MVAPATARSYPERKQHSDLVLALPAVWTTPSYMHVWITYSNSPSQNHLLLLGLQTLLILELLLLLVGLAAL